MYSSEKCYQRQCANCGNLKPSDFLSINAHVDIQDSVSWPMWKKQNARFELLHITGTFCALLQEIDSLWPIFVLHSYYTRQQREYIAHIREISSCTTFAVVQMNFAQNFSLVVQREIQSAYYSREKVIIFTVFIKVDEEHRNMAIISDYIAHDTKFVYFTQKFIIELTRQTYKNVFKINYVSDGAPSHSKS